MGNAYDAGEHLTGAVKKLTDKGFGFISVEGRSGDLFFHNKHLINGLRIEHLQEGDVLEFDVGQNEKGFFADKITRS